jgi:hypothetical protein
MGDRAYWQTYRDRLSNSIELMRAGLENRLDSDDHVRSSISLTHRNIRDVQEVREAETHLAAVDRLLASAGQLE